ncbi:SDR family oxidoreductase [Tabrizicola sp. J26]|uniref:SDR family oxidoreductase n=1 Tax=Alitabrizicola rongguiensis TaxID=2909234 RepID=UPI001F27895C|nr:SDR family oxidoreductase [Tabrizicola rongguiensis]MCF1710972.1 SDR family oxidoreductase [Tabrizicola rongguiensis]
MGLAGKVVVITGAAAGIGRAVALEAVREGVGALVLTDRDPDLARKTGELPGGVDVAFVQADLEDPAAAGRVAGAALDRFGRIDGLVNAAGLTTRGSFVDGTVETWDLLFDVNARAAFLLMQATIADMRRRRAGGSIVNILSMNAYCGIPELAIYAATKGALMTLTRNAANAHMADRIRVNGINLGWVATESERKMQAEVLGRGPDWETAEAARLPLGRLVTEEETARLAVFLLGAASVPMTGAIVDFEQKVAGAIG